MHIIEKIKFYKRKHIHVQFYMYKRERGEKIFHTAICIYVIRQYHYNYMASQDAYPHAVKKPPAIFSSKVVQSLMCVVALASKY